MRRHSRLKAIMSFQKTGNSSHGSLEKLPEQASTPWRRAAAANLGLAGLGLGRSTIQYLVIGQSVGKGTWQESVRKTSNSLGFMDGDDGMWSW
jgi:hypothetical protein